jgi:hypothetical protein
MIYIIAGYVIWKMHRSKFVVAVVVPETAKLDGAAGAD